MCQDLAEYDPFEPYCWDGGTENEIFDEPMEEYNWQEFLEADDFLVDNKN